MNQLKLTIDCDNAAFEPDPCQELARILKGLAHQLNQESGLRRATRRYVLRDLNGNRVGQAVWRLGAQPQL